MKCSGIWAKTDGLAMPLKITIVPGGNRRLKMCNKISNVGVNLEVNKKDYEGFFIFLV